MTCGFLFQLQKSKEREERLEEVIQAYEKIHLEKSNVQRDLDKMVSFYFYFHNLGKVQGLLSCDHFFLCVWADNSGGAAYGADLQSGVSSEAERDLPPETECSAPQQRRTSIPTTCQSGCTQRLVLSGSKSPKIKNMVLILSLQVAGSAKRSLDQHCHHRVNGTDRNRRTGLALDAFLTQVRNTIKKAIHLTLEPIDCKP